MSTRAQLTAQLRQLINDPESVFWTDEELQDTVHEAQEILAEHVLALKRTVIIARRTGTWCYQLEGVDRQIMAPHRIWLPDLKRRLDAVSLSQLDAYHNEWQTQIGDPWVWAPIDWRHFAIWPIPATSQGLMEIDCYVWPDALLDDGDSPEWFPATDEALLLYGESTAGLKQWDAGMASGKWQAFLHRLSLARNQASGRQMQGAYQARESTHDRRRTR